MKEQTHKSARKYKKWENLIYNHLAGYLFVVNSLLIYLWIFAVTYFLLVNLLEKQSYKA